MGTNFYLRNKKPRIVLDEITMHDSIETEIMNEIFEFCGNECPSVTCCPEYDCVLYRIEQIVVGQSNDIEIEAD